MCGTICWIGPETSIIPASPAAPPLISRVIQIIFFSLNPAKLAAMGAMPVTRIWNPMMCRAINIQPVATAANANSQPACIRVVSIITGRMPASGNRRDSGKFWPSGSFHGPWIR